MVDFETVRAPTDGAHLPGEKGRPTSSDPTALIDSLLGYRLTGHLIRLQIHKIKLDNVKSKPHYPSTMTSKTLRSALNKLGWHQRQMAQYLGVSDGAVSMWLNNHRLIPGPVALAVDAALKNVSEKPQAAQ